MAQGQTLQASAAKKADAAEKMQRYQSEIRRHRIVTSVSVCATFFITALFFMVVSGDRFASVLSFFGLHGISNNESGVYADCSLPENKHVAYCQPSGGASDKSWREVGRGKSAAFTLYDN